VGFGLGLALAGAMTSVVDEQ